MKHAKSRGVASLIRNIAISSTSLSLGLAQLYLLVSPGLTAETDAYFFVLAWATVPIQLLLLSIFYPSTLRAGVMERGARSGFMLSTVILTVLLSASAVMLLAVIGPGFADRAILISGLCCFSTVMSVPVWVKALELSASGRAAWLSGINLAPSAVGIVAMIIAPSADRVAAMLVGQSVGFMITWMLLNWMYGGALPGDGHPSLDRNTAWLSAQSVAAYAAILALQSGAATLPSSALSILGIATRCVSAGASLMSSAVLPLLTNRSSSSSSAVDRFIYLVTAGTFILCSAVVVLPRSLTGPYSQLTILSFAWLCCVVVNQSLHRWAFRSAPAKLSALTILVSLIIGGLLVLLVLRDRLDLGFVLALFIGLDYLGAVLFGLALRQRGAVVALTVACLPAALSIGR